MSGDSIGVLIFPTTFTEKSIYIRSTTASWDKTQNISIPVERCACTVNRFFFPQTSITTTTNIGTPSNSQ